MKSQSHFTKMRSSGLIVEHRQPSVALSVDLAYHISYRRIKGSIAIAANHPQALMSSVCKQWLRLIRLAEREKARTLDHQRIDNLDEIIRSMQAIRFTAKDPTDELLAYVSFARAEQFIAVTPACATLYITAPVTKLDQHMLASWMRPGSMVVVYGE